MTAWAHRTQAHTYIYITNFTTMKQGKDKCELLKSIRSYIAKKYGLDYSPSECSHQGDCLGTCPKCDSELQDIQAQLHAKGITDITADEQLNELFHRYLDTIHSEEVVKPSAPMHRIGEMEEGSMPDPENYALEGDITPQPPVVRRLFMQCRIAGTVYHDIWDIWNELYEGAPLALVRDRRNLYDRNAVAVALKDDYNGNPDDFDFRFILGYIPHTDNEALATLLDMGWENLLEAEISEIREDGPMSERLQMEVYVVGNPDADIKEDDADLFHMVCLQDAEKWERFKRDLWNKGFAYFRWGGFPPFDLHLPEKNGMVVFIHEADDTYEVYLMKVIATDEDCLPFVNDINELHATDDCRPFALTNIYGPMKSNNATWGTLIQHKAGCSQPDHPLPQKDRELFWNLMEDEYGCTHLPEPH